MTELNSRKIFAKNLRYYVEKSGKSQKEIAIIVGVPTSTFNDWINGKKYPRIDKIEKLADLFGILKSDLIEDKNEKSANNGLSANKLELMNFVKSVPEEKAELILRVIKSIVESD